MAAIVNWLNQQMNSNLSIGGVKSARKSFGLDVVRSFAIFSVIGVHFFSLNTEFTSSPVAGISMIIQSLGYSIFHCGVPLFLLLTGFLNVNKTCCRTYYSKIWRVLAAYVSFSVVTLVFRHFAFGEPLTFLSSVKRILDFSAIRYAWYIEMWIGLFLLVPFLNILYKGIETRRQKEILILILVFLTLAVRNIKGSGPSYLPDYWADCYPLTYYFIGAYIREYAPRINKLYLLTTVILLGLVSPIFTVIVRPGHVLPSNFAVCYDIVNVISSVSIFLMLYDLKTSRPAAGKAVGWVSLLSLDMYLCCYIFDSVVYPWFKDRYFVDQSSFGIYFFIIVPVIFFGSFILSLVKYMIFSLPGLVRFR